MTIGYHQRIKELQNKLNIHFQDEEILITALTHKSFCHHQKQILHNERLEFLGDAVLKIIVSEALFNQYPSFSEGELSKIRGQFVSDKTLATLAKRLNLGDYMRFSTNEIKTGGRTRPSNLANAMEAILGAYFLDQSLETVQQFLLLLMNEHADLFMIESSELDYKSRLQELLQQKRLPLPEYNIHKEEGPDHSKVFQVKGTIRVHHQIYSEIGIASTKKEAEQLAAKSLLDIMI